MTRAAQAIFKKARNLPVESRADLVELLIESIAEDDVPARGKIDKAWAKEAKDRFAAFLRGEIKAAPMGKVMSALRKRHTP